MWTRIISVWLLFGYCCVVYGQGDFSMATLNGRDYWIYTPSSYTGDVAAPLVVALHGCSQSATIFAVDTELNDYAEERNFIVLYPEQPSSSNSSNCWNWFLEEHQFRMSGEPQLNAAIINQVISEKNIATDQIFGLGMSAGAAEAVIMGATYPDLFAAISVSAGLEYMGGTTAAEAVGSQVTGIAPDTDVQGERAYQEMQKSTPRLMKVIAFHGSMDATVQPNNSEAIMEQWGQTNDLVVDGIDNDDITADVVATETGQVPNGRTFTRTTYEDENGSVIMEKYIIDGMTHRYSGGPANAEGGSIYTDPTGPKATELSLDFFGITNNDALDIHPDFDFTAKAEEHQIILHWQVNNLDVSSVIVERATTLGEFEEIGVAAVYKQKIVFTDQNFPASKELYYRLRWKDTNRNNLFSNSEIVRIQRSTTSLNIMPNPVNNLLTIQYNLVVDGNIQIRLYQANGQLVKTMIDTYQPKGNAELTTDVTNLPPGTYFCQLLSSEETKIVKIHILD